MTTTALVTRAQAKENQMVMLCNLALSDRLSTASGGAVQIVPGADLEIDRPPLRRSPAHHSGEPRRRHGAGAMHGLLLGGLEIQDRCCRRLPWAGGVTGRGAVFEKPMRSWHARKRYLETHYRNLDGVRFRRD